MTNVNLPSAERPFECALGQFHQAAERLHLDEGMREVLANTKREISVTFQNRNGSLATRFGRFRDRPVQRKNAPRLTEPRALLTSTSSSPPSPPGIVKSVTTRS